MKKALYISGIVLVNISVLGMLFKLQHWPGASILMLVGLVLFSLLFLPLAAINSFKGEGKKGMSLFVTGTICAILLILSIIFKVQRWPGSGWLQLIAIPLPFLVFLPLYLYKHSKNNGRADSSYLGVIFLMVYIAVYSALLSLNVSRNVVMSFVNADVRNLQLASVYEKQVIQLYNGMDNNAKEKVRPIFNSADKACQSIENAKVIIINNFTGEKLNHSSEGICLNLLRFPEATLSSYFNTFLVEEKNNFLADINSFKHSVANCFSNKESFYYTADPMFFHATPSSIQQFGGGSITIMGEISLLSKIQCLIRIAEYNAIVVSLINEKG